jgi:hypothetical protein
MHAPRSAPRAAARGSMEGPIARGERPWRRAAALVAMLLAAGCAGTPPPPQAGVARADPRPVAAGSLIASPIGTDANPARPWELALLPRQTKPVTEFSVVELDGQRVLRVSASRSYGKLMHPIDANGKARPRVLHWDWRVDRAPEADLRQRSGDDVALRVCAFFDWPMDRMPLIDRTRLLAAEAIAGQELPTAAICWVWDAALPAGTVMPNAFTRRLRMIVVDGDGSRTQWRSHTRDLLADFRTAFADEWRDGDVLPAVRAVAIGSDTDNTAGEGLGFVRAISLRD